MHFSRQNILIIHNCLITKLHRISIYSRKIRFERQGTSRIIKSHNRNISSNTKPHFPKYLISTNCHHVIRKYNRIQIRISTHQISHYFLTVLSEIAIYYTAFLVCDPMITQAFSICIQTLHCIITGHCATDKSDPSALMCLNQMRNTFIKSEAIIKAYTRISLYFS